MKFFAILPFILPAFAAEVFVVKASSAGSGQLKNTQIFKVDSHPNVFSVGGNQGKELFLTFGKDGTLYDQDGRGINMDAKTGEMGNSAPFGGKATPGFAIKDGNLIFNGKNEWRACPSGQNQYSLAMSKCVGGSPIVLQKVTIKK